MILVPPLLWWAAFVTPLGLSGRSPSCHTFTSFGEAWTLSAKLPDAYSQLQASIVWTSQDVETLSVFTVHHYCVHADCSFSGQNLTCTNQQVPVTLGRSITYTARALATGFLNNSATLESASGDKGPAVVQVKVETTCEKARLEGADVKAIVCSSGTQRKPNSNDTTPASQNNCCVSARPEKTR